MELARPLLEKLLALSGPLREGERLETRYRDELSLIVGTTREDFCCLLALARRPPPDDQLGDIVREDFELTLANILGAICSRNGDDPTSALEALLFLPQARAVAIEALSIARPRRSVEALRATIACAELDESERSAIAEVLRQIGGAEPSLPRAAYAAMTMI